MGILVSLTLNIQTIISYIIKSAKFEFEIFYLFNLSCNTNLLKVFGTVENETALVDSFCFEILFGLLYQRGIHTRHLTFKPIRKVVQDAHTVFCGLEKKN